MPTINMLSSAHKVKGQGVSSAYIEQVRLVQEGLKGKYDILENSSKKCDILHFHTIDLKHFFRAGFSKKRSSSIGYVHFLPETINESLKLPGIARITFYKYIIDFYNNMDFLVTVNPYFIGELEKHGISREKITYIPNYVSNDRFYPYNFEKKMGIREELGIPLDKFVSLGVGQVQTRKGVLDFIEVAKRLPDYYFIWAGGFSFGTMTDGYKELKEIMDNPPENVRFLGIIDRDKMNDIFNASDLMFLPSFSELFPMTILESMCCKIPILLRDLDIYEDILFDFYVKEDDIEGFAREITKLNESDEYYSYWSKKSSEGHRFYSEESVLKMWSDFYDMVYNHAENAKPAPVQW